ncbi:hypothetical protein ACFE04_023827 [Oxalis oulophora]
MKTFRRASASFFKVLLGDNWSTKLSVPLDFMKNFNGEEPKVSTLTSSTGKSWSVLMEKSDKCYFFSKGWSEFVKYHDLKVGDFLVFWLTSNSSFDVVMYSNSACEKETPFVTDPSTSNMKTFPRGYASFFKVLLGECWSTKLKLPQDFIKNFNGEQPKVSTLTSSTGKSWSVLMDKTEKSYFFSKGWSKFVTDHDLQIGDFLVFWLTSNSTFEVVIYGNNACERITPSVSKNYPGRATPSVMMKREKFKLKKGPIKADGVDSIEQSNNLQFVRKISQDKNMKYRIMLPAKFARETGLVSKNEVTLKYMTESGDCEEWPVTVQRDLGNINLRLSAGFAKFFNAKELSAGDSCLFEFVDGSLHVKVSRK